MKLVHRTAHLCTRAEYGGLFHLVIEHRTHAREIATLADGVRKIEALLGNLIGVRVATSVGAYGDGCRNVTTGISHGVVVVAFDYAAIGDLGERLCDVSSTL